MNSKKSKEKKSSKKSKRKSKSDADADRLVELTVERISLAKRGNPDVQVSGMVSQDVVQYFRKYDSDKHHNTTNHPRYKLATDPLFIARKAPPLHGAALTYYKSEAKVREERYEREFDWLIKQKKQQEGNNDKPENTKRTTNSVKFKRKTSKIALERIEEEYEGDSFDSFSKAFDVFYAYHNSAAHSSDEQGFWWEKLESSSDDRSSDSSGSNHSSNQTEITTLDNTLKSGQYPRRDYMEQTLKSVSDHRREYNDFAETLRPQSYSHGIEQSIQLNQSVKNFNKDTNNLHKHSSDMHDQNNILDDALDNHQFFDDMMKLTMQKLASITQIFKS